MTIKNVLFLCTGNSARSIMAEAYLGHAGRCLFRAYSAGSNPVGQIHPMALETLRDAGVRARALASKSWEVFALPASPKMERVITLCDDAGDRACPIWPGHPETYHWALPDPTSMEGSYLQRKAAFLDVFAQIRQHVDALLMSEPPLGALMEHAARGEVVLTDG